MELQKGRPADTAGRLEKEIRTYGPYRNIENHRCGKDSASGNDGAGVSVCSSHAFWI